MDLDISKKMADEKEYLESGLVILARIITREELKKQSKGKEQTGSYSMEKKLLPRHRVYYPNNIRMEKKD